MCSSLSLVTKLIVKTGTRISLGSLVVALGVTLMLACAPSAPSPSRADVTSTLNQEVDRFIASFNESSGSNSESQLDSLDTTNSANMQRRDFDQALSRVELTQLGRSIQGYLPAYAAWLRYERAVAVVLPGALRGNIGTFAEYAVASRLLDPVDTHSLDADSATELSKAVCPGTMDPQAIRSVVAILDEMRSASRGGSYSKQQIYGLTPSSTTRTPPNERFMPS